MAYRTMEMRVVVKYEYLEAPDVTPDETLCSMLMEGVVEEAMRDGIFVGDTGLVIDNYDLSVETIGQE